MGVTFSGNLKWSEHASNILNKCHKSLYIIKRLKDRGCPADVTLYIYQALVVCHIAYAWPVWCDVQNKDFLPFLQIEKRVMRWTGMNMPSELRARLDKICKLLMIKLIKNSIDHPLAPFFKLRPETNYSLRNRIQYLPLFFKTMLTRNSFLRFYNSNL